MDPFVIICKSNVKCFVLLNGLLVLFFLSWIMVKYLRMPLDNWQSASLALDYWLRFCTRVSPPLLGVNLQYFWYVFNVKGPGDFKVLLW